MVGKKNKYKNHASVRKMKVQYSAPKMIIKGQERKILLTLICVTPTVTW